MSLDLNFSGDAEFPKYARTLVGGYTGSGKTLFATTAPDPLWIAAAPGMATLALVGGVRYVDVSSENQLFELKNLLADPEEAEVTFQGKVQTLVVDTVDELQRRLIQGRLDKEKRSEIKADDWNWIAARMNKIFEGLNELPYHIIYLTHLKELGGYDDNYVVKPSLQGGFVDQIHSHVDSSLWLRSHGYWNVQADLILENTDERIEPVTLDLPDHESEWKSESYLVTRPTIQAEWCHDHTNTLPAQFELNFEDDYVRLLALRSEVELDESRSVSLDPDQVPGTLPVKDENVPGMSSNDTIAAILKRRKEETTAKETN